MLIFKIINIIFEKIININNFVYKNISFYFNKMGFLSGVGKWIRENW